MNVKIDKKIVGYTVVDQDTSEATQQSNDLMRRPLTLDGSTYRFKPSAPYKEEWVYITVNDIEMDGKRRPFEVFINQRDPRQAEHLTAIMILITSNLRRGGDISFIPEELKHMYSPNGGFYAGKGSGLPTGRYIPSLVAAIGYKLEEHWNRNSNPVTQISTQEAERQSVGAAMVKPGNADEWCTKCDCAMRMEGGCSVCPNCGESRCC